MVEYAGIPGAMLSTARGGDSVWSKGPIPAHRFLREVVQRARTQGIGVGWVSILDPTNMARALDVPDAWQFIAYLCVGYPEEEHTDPELVRHEWQARVDISKFMVER